MHAFATPTLLILDPGDTLIWRFGSSYFTNQINIFDHSQVVTVYFVDKEPPLLSTPSPAVVHEESVVIANEDWLHWAYYLNRGSTINVQFTTTSGSCHYYLIRGESAFKAWQDNPTDTNWMVSKYSSNSQPSSASTYVSTSDLYYLVFDNDSPYLAASVRLKLSLLRTQYDLSGISPMCTPGAAPSCNLPIGFSESRQVMLAAPQLLGNGTEGPAAEQTYELEIFNKPRTSGLVAFWLAIPAILLFVCGIVHCVQSYKDYRGAMEREDSSVVPVNAFVFSPLSHRNDSEQSLPGIELLDAQGFGLVVAEVVEPCSSKSSRPVFASEVETTPLVRAGPAPSAPPL